MGCIINLVSMFFLFSFGFEFDVYRLFIVPIWSVYMQYLWYFDHSNKLQFLVIQQAEVLLNFLVGVFSSAGNPKKLIESDSTLLQSEI